MDINSVIRELRVDWEDLLVDDFDPLPYIIKLEKEDSIEANNFRNMFHKVEKIMEQILEKDYQLFNDSMLMFTNFYESNQNNIKQLENEINFCDDILQLNTKRKLETEEIKHLLWLDEYNKKIKIFNELMNNIDNSIYNENYVYSSSLLKEAFDLYEEYNFNKIKKINLKKLRSKRKCVLKYLYGEVEQFLSGNTTDYREQCDSLISLGGIKYLDSNLISNLSKIIIKEINNINSKLKENVKEAIKMITEFFELFLNRLRALISYCLTCETEKLNFTFFEVEIESDNKIIKQEYPRILNDLLFSHFKRVVQLFCFKQNEYDYDLHFEISDMIDRVNYEEYFNEEIKSSENEKEIKMLLFANSSLEYLFLFQENVNRLRNEEISKYIHKQIKNKYFKNKNHKIQRKVIFILSDKKEFQVDSFSGFAKFNEKIDFNEIFYKKEFNDKKFLDFIFEIINRKITIYFYYIFKGRVSLLRKEDSLKEKILKQEFENSVPLTNNQVKDISAMIKTLKKIENICKENELQEKEESTETEQEKTAILEKSDAQQSEDSLSKPSIEGSFVGFNDLITLFSETLKNEYCLEFMSYFNCFYKDRSKFDFFVNKLESLFTKFDSDCNVNEHVFSILNYYIKNMLKILDVNTLKDLKEFRDQLVLLDDILSEIKFKPTDSLCFCIDMFSSLMEGKGATSEENKFLKRLN